jgi:hypothetical protein
VVIVASCLRELLDRVMRDQRRGVTLAARDGERTKEARLTEFDVLQGGVGRIAPMDHGPLDSPYAISNKRYGALRHVLHDVGGQPDLPVPFCEKVEEPWEMNTYVTCECLGWRGVCNSEERRRGENDLGATLYFSLPYYARWATVAAKTLIDKGLITPDELSVKVDEVRARLEGER